MYSVLRFLLHTILKAFYRYEVVGTENLPKQGMIIAANHVSYWDPFVMGCGLPKTKKIHFMAKEELFKVPVLKQIMTLGGTFPVRRGAADRNAIRMSVAFLEKGDALGIFPEGTRSKDGKVRRLQPGMAMIALKAGVPIIPTAIIGTLKFSQGQWFPKFSVVYGNPVLPNPGKTDKENMEYLTETVHSEITKMLATANGDLA
ncbi:MAG: 1-acyl-sn-glycerol-3-phosphate acyltransferase [Firmicutes bacterium]|nr:1-acyl-sn-glycerol-3-phosphate acyltransferase [Bacillota bacterium]